VQLKVHGVPAYRELQQQTHFLQKFAGAFNILLKNTAKAEQSKA
jgi:hypothetical protein